MTIGRTSVDGTRWPQRGVTIAEWLDLGVDSYQQLIDQHSARPAQGSIAAVDSLTITAHEPRHASAGAWYAMFTLVGAGEMMRALAALYRSSVDRGLTRGHLPVMRTIQEHVGRVVWLCEPGAVVYGPGEDPPPPVSDEWAQRRYRALLVHLEWMDDCLSHLVMAGASGQDEARQARDTAAAQVAAAETGTAIPERRPGYTAFAQLAQETAERLHGTHGIVAPRLGYKRASETSHGGLYGLHGDKAVDPSGRYVFGQNNSDLDAVAQQVAAWWITGVVVVSEVNGWDGDAALAGFTDTWRALFP